MTAEEYFPARGPLLQFTVVGVVRGPDDLDASAEGGFIASQGFLDTVNGPPPAMLPFLWAPVGLRYHALHHLMPRLPYHNLGIAHRRLVEALPVDHAYRQVEQRELVSALARLVGRMRLKR